MKSRLIFSIAIVFCSVLYAQQEPQYSQYMYNMSTVNPAYVTNQSGLISTGLLYRRQWTGIEGSPETANVFGNIPLSEKIELSVNYINDRIGEAISTNNNFFNVDFAYITRISDRFKLSYGLKVGINSFKLDASGSDVADDPAFAANNSELQLNIGAGLFLFSNNFYAGISSPNLLPNDVAVDGIGVSQSKTHLYGVTGFVFDLVDEVKLKPSMVIKQVLDSPLTFDISLNSLIYNRFELGVSYRYEDAFIALAGFNITRNLKVGYSYDFSTSELSGYNNGSHEIILLYNFDLLNFSNKYTSPRFY
ncbi:type IX secretion system membrane protein PorP/SprF [Aquimarina sp. MMG015]|uniref:PorP/SprF family type IX secretion system membrane protein n=1 Tax=unclassified Aquimarina TaxID=2627091 RepID=UPI000E52B928|nr:MULTISPECIES: type IX secretion system membrane protein PorP/SprF [unclassified Aquimarina]AXT55460.1 type IX secretion system membrane protein PorP/SprF [Aquimarina sp. AD1]MBQ4802437.1 type IX secretion system membrane protein PorP/SprF [Aquimarina sp. MMG015]